MTKHLASFAGAVALGLLLFVNTAQAAILYSQGITLAPGWNVVSTPRVLDSHSFSAAETSANFDIYVLDSSQQSGWATMAAEGQTEFTPLYGYFIDNKTGTNQTLTFNYTDNTNPSARLFQRTFPKTGWYSLGIANPTYAVRAIATTTLDTDNPSNILSALSGDYQTAVDFTDGDFSADQNAVAVAASWKAATAATVNSLNDLRETKGYAVYITQSGALYNGFQNNDIPATTTSNATVGISGYDPNISRNESLGTKGLTFSAIHITAGAVEDQRLLWITWNQTGSVGSTGFANLVTVVNGTSYPVTVDATGKYFTAQFPGGILISKGNSVDAYIKGDVTGSNSASSTVEFDIYRAPDIYLVGQTYGNAVLPITTTSGGIYTAGNNSSSGFQNSGNPFYFGSTVTLTSIPLTISLASTVAPQNIAANVSNQVLGGFTTNFTGEPVTVQSIPVTVGSSTGAAQLQNVSLVDQNGNVVAGPVDENMTTGKITFNSSVTFPVGAMTYTIKGMVATGATNGSTYTLSTNPSNWTSPVGQNSGSYVSLPDTSIVMSQMTVKNGALNISASASPASTNITTNQNNYTLANIVLDASNSGEDVRLNSLPIVVNATSTTDTASLASNLTNCQLYNGSTVLNNQAVGNSQWGQNPTNVTGVEANFLFTNSLVVPKGTTVTLALQCNIGGSLYSGEYFTAGVSQYYTPTVTGAVSGNTISSSNGLTVTSSASGRMTVGTPTMAVSVPTPISYAQVAGGTTGITVGTFTLQPTTGSVSLQNIGLALNSNNASTSDIMNGVVSIWNGSTQIGTANFSGKTPTTLNGSGSYYLATSTISSVNLPQNVQTTLTLKADMSAVGIGQSGTSGHEILVGLANANGTSGNSQVNSGPGSMPLKGAGIAIFATTPTVALSNFLPTGGISDGRLIAFSVTANSKNGVGLGFLKFTIAPSTGTTVTGPQLYAYSDSAFSQPAGGTSNGIAGSTSLTGTTASTTFSNPIEIAAGTTEYFLLKGTVSSSNSTYNVATTLVGDGTDLAPNMNAVSGLSSANFVWSPNSTTTALTSTNDWTNGYGVSGLPSIGITQNRTN